MTDYGGRLLLRMEEAADVLTLGRSTVYELARTGQLETVQIGKSRRVPVQAIDDFVERARRGEVVM